MITSPLSNIAEQTAALLAAMGVPPETSSRGGLTAHTPITGEAIGAVEPAAPADVARMSEAAHAAFLVWRAMPAPRRGELVRLLGEELRAHKAALGRLVSIEAGKILSEAQGEVQEMIDICDFAVGLSRQLYGLTIASERPEHRMMETWHPLGVTGIITAFNFPDRGVGVERRHRAGLRRRLRVEAVREDPADRAGDGRPLQARRSPFRRPGRRGARRPHATRHRRSRGGGGHRRSPPGPAGLGHRLDGHGPRGRAPAGGPLRPRHPGAGRQQRRHRLPLGRPRPDPASRRLRGHGHGGAALHHPAPPVRARERLRQTRAPSGGGLELGLRSAIRWTKACWSAR